MIEPIPHNQIQASPLNPRKSFSPEGITELAASIQAEGLLQNLVVRKVGDKFPTFEIAAGERRWRALQHLIATGVLPEDHPVPCRVADLTDLELLQLATSENMNRADMSPLEEARAFQQMLALGSDVDTISAETGLSVPTVRKRLALVERLSGVAQEALEAGQINLGQAQALTTTSPIFQDSLLNDLEEGERITMTADRIRQEFQREAPAVSVARFDLTLYRGTLTKPNIFAEDAEDRFDDVEQFRRLQGEAVQKLADEAKRSWGWVQVEKRTSDVLSWEFEQVPEDEEIDFKEHGVVIHYQPDWGDGRVHIFERVRKRKSTSSSSSAPRAEVDPLALTQKHREQIARHRRRALQTAIVQHRRRHLPQLLILMLTPNTRVDSHLSQAWKVDLSDAPPAVMEALDRFKDSAPTVHALLTSSGDWQALPDMSTAWAELAELDESSLHLLLAVVTARLIQVSGDRLNDVNSAVFWGYWADDHLPTFADLGEEWLQLYRPARLQQVSQAILGYSGEGKTKKELINLITAAQSQDVPAEMQLEQAE